MFPIQTGEFLSKSRNSNKNRKRRLDQAFENYQNLFCARVLLFTELKFSYMESVKCSHKDQRP